MKKALLAVLAIALVIGFAGCSWFQKGSPYYPLAEGNKWEYSGTSKTIMDYPEGMDDIEITVNTTVVSEVMALEETTGDEPIEVWKIKTILTVDVEDVDPTTSYSYVDADKDYIYFYKDLDATEEWYKIPSKPDKDDTWTTEIMTITETIDPETGDTLVDTTYFKTNYTVVETGVEAFGDYTDCLKIEAKPEDYGDYDSHESFDYWAKDVGTVMSKFKWVITRPFDEENTFTMTAEGETKLTKFTEGE